MEGGRDLGAVTPYWSFIRAALAGPDEVGAIGVTASRKIPQHADRADHRGCRHTPDKHGTPIAAAITGKASKVPHGGNIAMRGRTTTVNTLPWGRSLVNSPITVRPGGGEQHTQAAHRRRPRPSRRVNQRMPPSAAPARASAARRNRRQRSIRQYRKTYVSRLVRSAVPPSVGNCRAWCRQPLSG